MKESSLRYGLIYGGVMIALFVLSHLLIGMGPETFDVSEAIGYGIMLLTSSTVVLGIRSFRDQRNRGSLSFGEGVKVGSKISAVGGLLFAMYNFILVTWIYPEFYGEYMAFYEDKIRQSGRSLGEIAEELQRLQNYPEWMGSPLGQSLLMFITVLAIGCVFAVVGSAVLRRSKA